MPVHAQSVISPWLNSFYPAFYNALTTLENSAYTTDTVVKWQGLFNSLDSKITSYKETPRAAAFYDFMNAYYMYYVMNQLYGTDGSSMAAGDGRTIFSMNGYTETTIARSTSFYNDWVTSAGSGATVASVTRVGGVITAIAFGSGGTGYTAGQVFLGISGGGGSGAYATIGVSAGGLLNPVMVHGGSGYTSTPTVNICVGTSVKIAADIAAINGAITVENATMAALIPTYKTTVVPMVTRLLFEDVAPLNPVTKPLLLTKFFTNLHYKQVYQYLEMSPLPVPPGA